MIIELVQFDVYCVTMNPIQEKEKGNIPNPFQSDDVKLGFICPHGMLNEEMLIYIQKYHKSKYKMTLTLTEKQITLSQE